ncbi:MAG: peptidoglycan DD-metalloendopeptidase family protein [Cyanobacteria bacterium]|nr:peptidoglycan DD-metalloendopeptidase family protein [Cyanobacteria bacterium GSL.Bin1]
MASLTLPILAISAVAEPVGAWQKKASVSHPDSRVNVGSLRMSVGQPGEFEAISPQLTIQPITYHQIQPGDTLWELAQKYDISTRELAEYNAITTQDLLQIGETLEIPLPQNLAQQEPQLLNFRSGAIGGAISSDHSENIVLESFVEETSISPVPRVINQDTLAPREESENSLSQVPIQQFLADVQKLQANYEKEPVEPLEGSDLEWSSHSEGDHQGKVFSPVESSESSPSSYPNSLATAPIKVEFYNPSLSAPIGEMVSPELPPLSSPEQYLPSHPQKFDGYIWPAEGVFTSGYGMRWGRMHRGIDIAAPIGTPILAAAPGEVVVAGWHNGGYGNLVKLKHPDGSLTLYAHNNKVLVQKGQEVDQGQQIAEMGSTGRSTGPHLHFEIHPAGTGAKNPLAYLPKR